MKRHPKGEIGTADEILDRIGNASQELGIGFGQPAYGPGPGVRAVGYARECPTIIIECLKTSLESIVQDAYQRVVAKADGFVAELSQNFGHVRPVIAQALRRLCHAMSSWVLAREERGVCRNCPLGRGYGLLKQRTARRESIQVRANRSRVAITPQSVGTLGVQYHEYDIRRSHICNPTINSWLT